MTAIVYPFRYWIAGGAVLGLLLSVGLVATTLTLASRRAERMQLSRLSAEVEYWTGLASRAVGDEVCTPAQQVADDN